MRNVPETIHAYKIPRLNWIFVFFSLLFVASMIWMIWFDYIGYRKWKDYQKEFQNIEAAKLQKDLQDAQAKAEQAGLKDIQKQLAEQKAKIAENKTKLDDAVAEADKKRVAFENKDTEYKFRKAELDAQKYNHDVAFEELHENPEDPKAKSRYRDQKALLDKLGEEVAELEREAQELEKVYKEALAAVDQIVGEKTALEKEVNRLLSSRVLAESRLDKLTNSLIQAVVNAPFLEITSPTIRVKQIELEDHRFNVNFAEVPRVDRCISCHNGIARSDPPLDGAGEARQTPSAADIKSGNFRFADLPQPHKAHPKLDVFVGESSHHPIDRFGCTPCHWGWDRGMDFSSAAHMPDEEKLVKVTLNSNGNGKPKIVEKSQTEAWIDKYHWHEMHHAEQKMRPSAFIESSCLKCHSGETEIAHAENLTHGIRLIEQAGCYSCHKAKPLETLVSHTVKEGEDLTAVARIYNSDPEGIRAASELKSDKVYKGLEVKVPVRTLTKTGPSLNKISSKLDKDWVRNWLAEPKRFRPNTFMPQFWQLEDTHLRLTNLTEHITYKGVSGKEFEMRERDAVEIDAITEFIFTLSDAQKPPASPVPGDAGRGKTLVANLGCFACHVVNERLEKDSHYSDGTPVDDKQFPLLTFASAKLPSLSEAQYKRSRSQGPMLHGSGNKMDASWLYAWLKDPKQYHPHTRMPNLRLSDQEAADIASYLVTLRSEEFEKLMEEEKKIREKNASFYERARNDMVQEYLEGEYSKAEAAARVKNNEFNDKTSDFIRRVKYSDVSELLSRWNEAINGVAKMSAEPEPDSEKEIKRRSTAKSRVERLALELRQKASERPAVAALLNGWADKLPALSERAAAWNRLEEKDRMEVLSAARTTQAAAVKAFEHFAQTQAGALEVEVKKKLYLGEKLVGRYGCYSCHSIQGFDNAKPIGAELSEWGTKQTTTLDFGYLEGKIDHSNYAYVQQKVRAPRSYDKTEVKKPQEWLKMPQFNFNQEQIKAIAVAIMGMTDEKMLPQARRNLTESEFQIENGRWMMKELNCVGCHIVENKGGAILTTLDASQKQLWPPNLQGVGTKVKPTWLYHFLKAPDEFKYRYWLNVRMPTFGFSDEQINTLTRYFALLDKQSYPFEDGGLQATYTPSAESVGVGGQIYETFQCYKCHNVRPADTAGRSSNIGPNMAQVKERMRPRGLIPWLRNPEHVTPGVNMPANWPTEPEGQNPLPNVLGGDTMKQIHAVADYLLTYDGSIEAKHPTPKEEPAAPGKGGAEYE